jgi:hypothetical protein
MSSTPRAWPPVPPNETRGQRLRRLVGLAAQVGLLAAVLLLWSFSFQLFVNDVAQFVARLYG